MANSTIKNPLKTKTETVSIPAITGGNIETVTTSISFIPSAIQIKDDVYSYALGITNWYLENGVLILKVHNSMSVSRPQANAKITLIY